MPIAFESNLKTTSLRQIDSNKTMKRSSDVYFRFLQLADAIRGLPSLQPLDPLEERILALIARTGEQDGRLCVRDMMAKEQLGAPATIHTRLKSMRAKGWIMLSDTEDARRKQIELTQGAIRYFETLSKCIVEAAKQGA